MDTSTKNVISLIRLSTDEQACEGRAGIGRQQTDITRLAKQFGLTIVREVVVIDTSGIDTLRDPEFLTIFKDLERADIAGVVMSALDRLVRPYYGSDFGVFDPFQRNKKKIWSAVEGELDVAGDMGFMAMLFSGGKSGLEWRELRRRTVDGKESLRKQGCHVSGPQHLPKGLLFIRRAKGIGYWEYDPAVCALTVRAYDMLFDGISYTAIMPLLGFQCPEAVQAHLRNWAWKGIRRYTRVLTGDKIFTKKGKKYKNSIAREVPLDVVMCGADGQPLTPLIDPARWAEAQEIMDRRRLEWSKTVGKKTSAEFLAEGVGRCACGCKLYAQVNPKRPADRGGEFYYCSSQKKGKRCGARSIRRARLDSAVESLVTELLLDVDFLSGILTAAITAAVDTERNAADAKAARAIRTKIAELQKAQERLKDFVEDGTFTKEDYRKRMQKNLNAIRELRASVPNQAAAEQCNPAELAEAVANWFARFGTMLFGEKRTLLRSAVREVTVEDSMATGRKSAGAITGITFSGGWLGSLSAAAVGRNSASMSSTGRQIPTKLIPDISITLPQPWRLAA